MARLFIGFWTILAAIPIGFWLYFNGSMALYHWQNATVDPLITIDTTDQGGKPIHARVDIYDASSYLDPAERDLVKWARLSNRICRGLEKPGEMKMKQGYPSVSLRIDGM
jgi:hypothetical protein